MPIKKLILQDLDLVYSQWEGCVTIDQIIEAQELYTAMPNYRPTQQYLVDLREVTDARFNFSRFDDVVAVVKAHRADLLPGEPGAESCYGDVLAPDDLTFGMARQFQTVSELRGGLSVSIHRCVDTLAAQIRRPTQAIIDLLNRGGFGATA